MKPKQLRRNKEHWFLRYIGTCPMCNRDVSYSVKMVGRKPKNPAERTIIMNYSDTRDKCEG